MRPALLALLLVACTAPDPRPWHCPDGKLPDPYCACSTDTDCAQWGGNGDPDPVSTDEDWEGDTCAETDEGCPGDEPYEEAKS